MIPITEVPGTRKLVYLDTSCWADDKQWGVQIEWNHQIQDTLAAHVSFPARLLLPNLPLMVDCFTYPQSPHVLSLSNGLCCLAGTRNRVKSCAAYFVSRHDATVRLALAPPGSSYLQKGKVADPHCTGRQGMGPIVALCCFQQLLLSRQTMSCGAVYSGRMGVQRSLCLINISDSSQSVLFGRTSGTGCSDASDQFHLRAKVL